MNINGGFFSDTQGHTPTEIAETTGSTTGNVGSSVTRSIQFLRKYFRHEKELLRP